MTYKKEKIKFVFGEQDLLYLKDEEDFNEFLDEFMTALKNNYIDQLQLRIELDRIKINLQDGKLKPKKYPALMLAHPSAHKLPWYFIYKQDLEKIYNFMSEEQNNNLQLINNRFNRER